MTQVSALAHVLSARIQAHGLSVSDLERDQALAYLGLLARWNKRINLTAFDLTCPSDAAIDRLVIEPFAASALVRPTDRVAVDVGSGGGSPAIPLAIRCPELRMTLVESRQRKASFLREAIRVLGLRASVAACRLEDVAEAGIASGSVDLVTIRAVRLGESTEGAIGRLLCDSGIVLFFGHKAESRLLSFSRIDGFAIGELFAGRK